MHNKYDKILREYNRKEESKNVESNINLNIKLLITYLMHRCSGSISNFQSQFMFEWMQHLIRMSQQWMCQGRHGNIFDRSWFQTIDTPSQDVVCYTYNNDHQRQYDVEPHRLTYTRCYTPSITHSHYVKEEISTIMAWNCLGMVWYCCEQLRTRDESLPCDTSY